MLKLKLSSLIWRTRTHVTVLLLSICLLFLLRLVEITTILYWFGIIVFGLAGTWFGVISAACSGKWYKVPYKPPDRQTAQAFITKLMSQREQHAPCKRHVVTSVNLDLAIQEILDLVTKDFVLSWYTTVGADGDRFKHLFQDFVWKTIEEFYRKVQSVDFFHFFTQNIVSIISKHFKDIRKSRKITKDSRPGTEFISHSWLASGEKELDFLRKVADVFLIHILPEEYVHCATARHMIREIVACCIFKPSVDIICDPDYFNQKLLSWLSYKEKIAEEHKRNYTYAANYEDFMKIIESCNDVEHLKQMRYNIISEIMQATTISNLKRAQGLKTDKEISPKSQSKGELLKARNLKRYLNQLTVAKSYSERRIQNLGGDDYRSSASGTPVSPTEHLPGKKVLSFLAIMSNPRACSSFLSFLKGTEADSLLRFWMAVEAMKHHCEGSVHQTGGKIYQMFVAPADGTVRLHLDRKFIKHMETFMLGDSGPEGFWDASDEVYSILEKKHYPSFILSDIFHSYIMDADDIPTNLQSPDRDLGEKITGRDSDCVPDCQRIAAHSTYAQDKLEKLKERLDNKTHALKALKAGQKMDEKIRKIAEEMEQEIQNLKTERRQLEFHIERTEVWAENIGHWKVQVSNAEIIQEEGKMVAYFVLVVHQIGTMVPMKSPSSTQGWVIFRRLDDFHALHNKLIQIQPSLKSRQLPTVGKFRVKSLDSAFLNRSKDRIQDYLNEVLEDERLAQNEAVFVFFSPSPEHLKHNLSPQRSKPSLANLFKSIPSRSQGDSDSEDELLFGVQDPSARSDKKKDSAAEPLYRLITELFELQGMFKWLRKTLMVFVQVTFGRSINRQLRETVQWIYSEPMLVYYMDQFREAYWPAGRLAEWSPPQTDKQKHHTRLQAKQTLLNNIPDALKNLVGEANSKQGAIKIFEALQSVHLNKHLFYNLLQEYMMEIFVDLKILKDQQALKRGSNLSVSRTSRSTNLEIDDQ